MATTAVMTGSTEPLLASQTTPPVVTHPRAAGKPTIEVHGARARVCVPDRFTPTVTYYPASTYLVITAQLRGPNLDVWA